MTYPSDADIDNAFPDNDAGDIGADDMRSFMKQMTAAGKDRQSIENLIVVATLPGTIDENALYFVTG